MPDQPAFAPSDALTSPYFQELLKQCIHCGMCLPACPTYGVFHTEMDNPRGRIALMGAAAGGRISLNGPFREHIDLCLGCRACETACPSGVRYGALVEVARGAIEDGRSHGVAERLVRWLALEQMLPHAGRLRLVARLMRVYQRLGLARLMRRLRFLPERLRTMEALLPPLPASYPAYPAVAPAIGPRHGRVAFFRGCVQDAFLADVNAATIRVLQRNGYDVHVVAGQTCCGAAALHTGADDLARDLARRNIDAFEGGDYDAVINNAGGCGAALKEYAHLLRDDAAYREPARRFAAQVQDISAFLDHNLHAVPRGAVNVRATYVDSCHLRHGQRIIDEPRRLLKTIPGLELVELARPDWCCGSAGVYNILHTNTANTVLDYKMTDVAATAADSIVTTNPGCQMQLLYGVRRSGLDAEVVHLVQLLDRSYTTEGQA